MKTTLLALASLLFCTVFNPCQAQPVTSNMLAAYKAFRGLQAFMTSSGNFSDPQNSERILGLLTSLKNNFHAVDQLPGKYKSEIGFSTNVGLINDLIADVLNRYKEGKKEYAFWRLRTVSTNCISCHSTYNVSLTFSDNQSFTSDLNDLQKGEFYLATRQLDHAEKSLTLALQNEKSGLLQMRVLRRILVLYLRMKNDPAAALKKLQEIAPSLKLSLDDRAELDSWIATLSNPEISNYKSWDSISAVSKIIRQAVALSDPLAHQVDSAKLLLATAALHSLLSDKKLKSEDRLEALYLLGFSYHELPLFFIDELPDFYLEECIEEGKGTETAKKAFKLYKDLVTLGFTGSAGTNIPSDVQLKVDEYYKKAFNIPEFQGKL